MKTSESDDVDFDLKKPLFIIGSPRSGTTFLGSILSAIPETEYFYLLLFPPHLAHCIASGNCKNVIQFLKWSLARNFADALGDRMRSRGLSVISAVRGDIPLVEVLRRHRRKINEIRLVYKEPFLAFIPKFICEAFPDCQIVHIIRDGRDVANSFIQKYNILNDNIFADEKLIMKEKYGEVAFPKEVNGKVVPWWIEEERAVEFLHTSQYHRAIWLWRVIVSRCLKEVESSDIINNSNYLSIKYENLCREPRRVGGKIVDFLNLKPGISYFRRLKKARVGSIGKHKRFVSKEDIKLAEREAGDLLKELDYLK